MVKLRNQADAVLGRRVGAGPDCITNGEYWLVQRIAPTAELFVDVGANKGEWAEAFASTMSKPKGDVFEPFPPTFELLVKRLSRSGWQDLQCHLLAMGEETGSELLYGTGPGDELASLVPGINSGMATSVKVVTLDDFYSTKDVLVDMLKIDAEGWDFKVLRGAKRLLAGGRIRTIQFEYNSPWRQSGATLSAAVQYLGAFGFKCYILRGDALLSFDPNYIGEYFRYTNVVAFKPDGHPLADVPKSELI